MQLNEAHSPLIPAQPDAIGGLSVWTTFGVVLQLALEHEDLSRRSVAEWMARLVPALETGQGRILLDNGSRPWGFASWIFANTEWHQRWLTGDRALPEHWQVPLQEDSDPHLWIVDLVVPFGQQLQALHHLKAVLPDYDAAWTFSLHSEEQIKGNSMPPRRLW